MNIKINSKFEAVSRLLARCSLKSPSHALVNQIADAARLLYGFNFED